MNEIAKIDERQPAPAGRKVFIKTYGCQMNVYDSERMGDALAADGYAPTQDIGDADLIVLNTCHIREKAAEKVYSALGRLRKIKEARAEAGRETMVAVTGCVAQAEGREIVRRAPVVDLVAGPQTYHRLPQFLREARMGKAVVATEFEIEEKFSQLPPATARQTRARGVAAFVTVQEGCDKFCTFCVVPYTRGAEVSRSFGQILDESRRLADAGVREITLLGQNVNAWHGAGANGARMRLGELLAAIADVPGIDRLRYTTSHPIDMDEGLIDAHRTLPELMPYLHLPVQAGSNRILKAMNRRHDRDYYFEIVSRIRAARPDIALSGDFIVGFPGESEAEFEETLALIREVGYAQAYSFKYSTRPGTPGAGLSGQIDDAVKSERLLRLQALLGDQQAAFNRGLEGREIDVLLERPGKTPDQILGRSPWLQSVVADASVGSIGDIVRLRVVSGGRNSLQGEALASA